MWQLSCPPRRMSSRRWSVFLRPLHMPGLRCVGEGPSAGYWTPPGGWRVFSPSLIRAYRYFGLDWWRYQNSHGVLVIQGVPPGKQSLRLKTRWNPFKPQRYRFCPLRASLLTLPIISKRVSVTPRTGALIGKRNNVKIVASSVVSWELVVPPRPVPLTIKLKNNVVLVYFMEYASFSLPPSFYVVPLHPPWGHNLDDNNGFYLLCAKNALSLLSIWRIFSLTYTSEYL